MLARLQRSLPLKNTFCRHLSNTTSLQARHKRPPNAQSDPVASAIDDILIQKPKKHPSSPPPQSAQPSPASSTVPVVPQKLPATNANGLSYAGLPDHQIFLQLPPASDPLLSYLTSLLTHDGRRATAARRVSRMLLYLHALTRAEPLSLLRDAVAKVAPVVRFIRQARATRSVQIPVAIQEKQRVRHALKWMLSASETRGGRTVEERLAREIVLVLNGTSGALRQKEVLHEQAAANRCVFQYVLIVGCSVTHVDAQWQYPCSQRSWQRMILTDAPQ